MQRPHLLVRTVRSSGSSTGILSVLLAVAALLLPLRGTGSISIVSSGSTAGTTYALNGAAYTQNFDSLPSSGTVTWSNNSTLPGWSVAQTTGTMNTALAFNDGSNNLPDLRITSVGTSGSSERAFAFQTHLAANPTYIGVGFLNQSGRTLDSFSLSYVAEQWRENTNQRTLTFTVQYRIGATVDDLNAAGGWTTIPELAYTSLNAVVGNYARSVSNVALSVPDGTSIWFRWVTANNSTAANNSQDTIAVDDVSISFAAAADGSPVITTQPAPQAVTVGADVTFTVVANGDPTLAYQWMKDGTPINGANSAALDLTAVQSSDAGSYTVEVSNDKGAALSAAAVLTVEVPVAPSITTQPVTQTVDVGTSVSLTVAASGSSPLSYQWRKNGNDIPSATSATLNLPNAQTSDSGDYTVFVSNSVGNVTSAVAVLTVQVPPPQAPAITQQPVAQSAFTGGQVTFTVAATGSAPLTYQWQRNTVAINGATGTSLTLTNVQPADAGSYRVVVTNGVGSVTSNAVSLNVSAALPITAFNLTGFATVGTGTTGGGVIPDTDPAYRKVSTPQQFVQAINDSNKTAGAVKVIEIMNDLNLGWNEVGATVRGLASNALRAHAAPKLHPVLIASGVSILDIKAKSPLTIFSANGSTLRHVNFNIKGTSNIIIRNLRFDELWEWDEVSKGDYDSNDWDFITISNGGEVSNVWIDHCTFTKAYDGAIDMKVGSKNITVSWCRIVGDDGDTNPNSFVRQQLAALEANKNSLTGYKFLRDTVGYTVDEIAQIIQGHDKGALMGATSLNSGNTTLTGTFHHIWFQNVWDRVVPRLRGGNVHNYNIYVDDVGGLAARRMRDAKASANLSSSALNSFNNGSPYKMRPFLNGTISTEGGAILVEKSVYSDCITPLRNNQTNPANSVYTGKIMALDTIYRFNNADGSLTEVRGNSTDANNPLGPFQAAVIPFSWNLPNNTLPYPTPEMHDPANLPEILAAASGAGVLNWSADNWLRTVYVEDTTIPPSIVVAPQSASIAAGADATFTVQAAGSATLTYQWKKNGQNLADNDRISGATSAVLTIADTVFGDAGDYTVTVTNANGNATSSAATLTIVAPTAPVITTQPADQQVVAGQSVQFSVDASGSAPFTYQWRKDGEDIVGATGAIFVIEIVHPDDAGSYSVVVTNLAGSVTSASATLGVTPATAAPVAAPATAVGNNGFTANWAEVAGATGYRLDVASGSSFDNYVPGYYDLDVGDALSRDVVGLASGTAYYYRVRALGAGGPSVSSATIAVTTAGVAATNVDVSQLTWYQTRTADTITLNTAAQTVTFTEGQTSASGYITHLPSAINLAVGQTLTVTINFETGTVVNSLTNALRFGLFNANGTRITASANTETNSAFNDDTGYMASYNLDTGAGTLLARIPGTGNGTLMGSTAAGLYLSAGAQVLSGAPEPITASTAYSLTLSLSREANSVGFTARLNGGATTNYVLSGTDSTTASVATGSFDEFAVRIAGGTNSLNTLRITALQFAVEATPQPDQPPVILTPPQSQTVAVGAPVTLSVAAGGTTPFTYQWRKDGTPINGANASTYVLSSATLGDNGSYDVVVTNAFGEVTSPAATLTVNPPMAVPTATAATAVGNTGFTANWNAAANATGYRLDVSTGSGFGTFVAGYQDLDVGNVLSRTVTGLNSGTTYYYRVRAVGSVGTSVSSNTITVTTGGAPSTEVDLSQLTWFKSRTADGIAANTAAKTVTFTEGQTSSSMYVATLPSSLSVAENQRLTLSFTLQTGTSVPSTANALRIGLHNNNGTALTANPSGDSNAAFTNDTGYMASYVFNTGVGALYGRNLGGANEQQLMGTTNQYTQLGSAEVSGTPAAFAPSTTYAVEIAITRRAGSTEVAYRINGGATVNYSVAGIDETSGSVGTAAFNQFAIRIAGGSGSINTFTLGGMTYSIENAPPPGPGTGYASWLEDYFTAEERANPAISGPLASAAGDGVSNLFKYALGLDPRAPLPGDWAEIESSAGGWVFAYRRPAARPDLVFGVEVSHNLVNWGTDNLVHELESTVDGVETWRAIYVPPVNAPANAFFRLKVTQ